MSRFIVFLQILAQLLPAIVAFVKAIETALPQGGAGAQKLALFRELVASAYQAAGEVGVALEDVLPTAERAASAVVGLFNKTGQFGTTQPPSA